MKRNYCLPIIKNRKQDIIEIIRQNLNDYRYFEVWLDYVEDVDEDFINQLVELLGKRLIILFRRQNLEPINMELAERLKIIKMLAGSGCLVDLDITSQETELTHIKEQSLSVTVLASYHNYKTTPDPVKLDEIIATMAGYRPAIYKVATLCQKEADAVQLLSLLLKLRASGQRCIVLGRGDLGKATRVFGTLWGNEMIFAPKTRGEASDLGQLTIDELNTIFKALGG